MPVRQAVYLLPDSPNAREDFEWLKSEVKAAGGDASVFAANTVDAWSDDSLVEEFRSARQEGYSALAREIEQVLSRLNATRRPRGRRAPATRRLVDVFRERLSGLERIDFFGSAGRDRVISLLGLLEDRALGTARSAGKAPASGALDVTTYRQRLWVTRPRPGVDRMGSAWLIRRFIDAAARFEFADGRNSLPTPEAIPFDMFGVEFSHHGECCTFETLCSVFAIQDPAATRIAAIVHDLDLKDGRFGAAEASTIGTLIDGLQLTTRDDSVLLEQGIMLFESLYLAFAQSSRATGPRPVAKPRARKAATGSRRSAAPRKRSR